MAKTREELEALKKEAEELSKKISELTPEELDEVAKAVTTLPVSLDDADYEAPEMIEGDAYGSGFLVPIAVLANVVANANAGINANVAITANAAMDVNAHVNVNVHTTANAVTD